jgi:midasin (ATPase involved in ribosome maturation)
MKGEEEMIKTTTTTLEAPTDVPEGSEGNGNGADDGEKDSSFTEKENTQLEKDGNEETQAEDSEEDESDDEQQENGVDDPELEQKIPSLDDGFYEVEVIRRKRTRKVTFFFSSFSSFLYFCVVVYDWFHFLRNRN